MESPKKQAAEILSEQKKRHRRMAVFACLALIVVVGTGVALRMNGRAMNQLKLSCILEREPVHQHTEACYTQTPEGEKVLSCGYADFVAHEHNEACYNKEGELVCTLPEVKEHKHTDECYETRRELACTIPESEGHVHTDECYEQVLICGLEESEEHTHTEECYEKTLICTLEEGEGAHTHGDDCYTEQKVLVCEKPEVILHTHDESCYLDENGNKVTDESGEPVLQCGLLEVKKHVHGDECMVNVPRDKEESSVSGVSPEEEPDAAVTLYENDQLKITARCEKPLPEKTLLGFEDISGEEQLLAGKDQLREAAGDETFELLSLMKLSFISETEGEPFASPVQLIIEPLKPQEALTAVMISEGQEDASEASPKAQVLELAKAEDGAYSLRLDAPALVAFGGAAAENPEEGTSSSAPLASVELPESLQISQSFAYDEDPLFHMEFHVSGVAVPKGSAQNAETVSAAEEHSVLSQPEGAGESADGKALTQGDASSEDNSSEDNSSLEASQEENTSSGLSDDTLSGAEEASAVSGEETSLPVNDEAEDSAASNDAQTPSAVEITGAETLPANTGLTYDPSQPLTFIVEPLSQEAEDYLRYAEFVKLEDREKELLPLEVFSYRLYYYGHELDMTLCSVSVTITSKQELEEKAKEAEEEALKEEKASNIKSEVESGGVLITALVPSDGTGSSEPQTPGFHIDERIYTTRREESAEEDETLLGLAEEEFSEGSGEICAASAYQVGSEEDGAGMSVMAKSAGQEASTFGLISSTHVNPHFKVQYYSYLDTVRKDGSTIPLIDTRGGNLPVNGNTNLPTFSLGLNSDGTMRTQNTLTEIYRSEDCSYFEKPNLKYFDALTNSAVDDNNQYSFRLRQIWILKDGKSADSSNRSDWVVYGEAYKGVTPDKAVSDCRKIHFTNRPESQANDCIYIQDGANIRLIYEPLSGTFSSPTSFFDYDINSVDFKGKTDGTMKTNRQGINSAGNYSGSGAKYGFGNANTGTGLKDERWQNAGVNNAINMANRVGGWGTADISYGKCTFGMVSGVDTSGNITFSDGISGPDGFLNASVETKGKTYYPGSLSFTRVGDTYTLSTASVEGAGGASSLERLYNPTCGSTTHTSTWTNNFWPLDSALYAKDLAFGDYTRESLRKFSGAGSPGNLPKADDGADHNNYFGMHYYVTFDLVEEYVGPLEYMFFGDDDMWVFLTEIDKNGNATGSGQQLVCDIGGVHTSQGEYVDLWDYIPHNAQTKAHSASKYRLDFCYTERGASGSTCWMQFTLPSVYSGDLAGPLKDSDFGSLRLEKQLERIIMNGQEEKERDAYDNGEEFVFQLTLTDKDGNQLADDYNYVKYSPNNPDGSGGDGEYFLLENSEVYNGAYITLKHGEYIEINHLPVGTKYTIAEIKNVVTGKTELPNGELQLTTGKTDYEYTSVFTGDVTTVTPGADELAKVEGVIVTPTSNEAQLVSVSNEYLAYELPKTGGPGVWYGIGAGTALLLLGGVLVILRLRKRPYWAE